MTPRVPAFARWEPVAVLSCRPRAGRGFSKKVFGGAEEGWLRQQALYDLAHVHRNRIK